MPESSVLVTGANGCIGSWVLKHALDRGWRAVVLDLADAPTRPRLLLDDDALATIDWRQGDVADTETVRHAVIDAGVEAVVHLGALQVPFCKADPVAGARVNVVGTANVMEAVREAGVKRFALASSIAALGSAAPGNPYLGTLYGAYKAANEEMARVYWQDWEVPSVVIRPGVVYGVGRDQGMTSAPTKAMLAATAGRAYTIPFGGRAAFLYAGDVADAFLTAVSQDREGAHIFDLNGDDHAVDEVVNLVRAAVPGAEVSSEGAELPFPPDVSDTPIRDFLGDFDHTPIADGVSETVDRFRTLLERGILDMTQLER